LKLSSVSIQQLSPYGDSRGGHSPGRTSPNVSSPSSPQKLNNSFESNSSSDYSNPSVNPLDAPKIFVNDRTLLTQNTKNIASQQKTTTDPGNKQCALDNKVFAEHFNLDDLSASFRSLYKSVFTQSTSSNSSSSSVGGANMFSGGNHQAAPPIGKIASGYLSDQENQWKHQGGIVVP